MTQHYINREDKDFISKLCCFKIVHKKKVMLSSHSRHQ